MYYSECSMIVQIVTSVVLKDDCHFYIAVLILLWLHLYFQGAHAYGAYDEQLIFFVPIPSSPSFGFAGLGTNTFGFADFDNLYIAANEEGITKMKHYINHPLPQPLYFNPEHK